MTVTVTTTSAVNSVLRVAPAAPAEAAAYFGASLAFHADVSDVAAALAADGDPGFVVVDSRSTASWDQGHVPGAIHLPTALIPEQAEQLLDKSVPVVTYCWGPGCNGATRAALALAELGFQVKEMLGGFEYWVREGFALRDLGGRGEGRGRPADRPGGRRELRLLKLSRSGQGRRVGSPRPPCSFWAWLDTRMLWWFPMWCGGWSRAGDRS